MQRINQNEHRASIRRRVAFAVFILSAAGILLSCLNPRPDTSARKPAPPPPATFREAVSSYYAGNFDESIFTLERLLAKQPQNIEALWELVRQFEESGSYEDAISTLKTLYGIDPDTDRVTDSLFVARVLSGQLSESESMLPLSHSTEETLFFEGFLAMETGKDARAAELFKKSIAMHENQPMAWYFLGEIAYASGDYGAAQSDFETVRRQNPGITLAIPPLARSILSQGKDKEAYPLLIRARDILPDNASIRNDIVKIEQEYPQLRERATAEAAVRQRYTLPPRVTTFPPPGASTREIRVGLAEDLHSLTFKPGGAFSIHSLDGASGLTYLGKGDRVLELTHDPNGISLSAPGEPPFLTWQSPVVLAYDDPADTTVLFNLVSESGSFFATSSDRAYRGEMIFRTESKGLTVVNRLPLEEYLYAVLPSEMFSFWPAEALKAQAVAARSYTLASMGAYNSRGFDLYGSVRSAAYQGVTNESPLTTNAVNATQGQVLEYEGKPLKAYYSANSGGYTEDSRVVWGEDSGMRAVADLLIGNRTEYLSLQQLYGWLRSDPASYSSTPPYFSPASYRWVKWVPSDEINRRANRLKKIGAILSIVTRGRGISGRVNKIEIIGVDGNLIVRGDRIRAVLGDLRSNLFTYRPLFGPDGKPQFFIFSGGGWGHGVGMDQDGAAGMASAGFTYTQILSHYYPRATLVNLQSGSEPTTKSGK